ncbi:MAG: amidohydrolase family protein [Bacteroidota bacterium]
MKFVYFLLITLSFTSFSQEINPLNGVKKSKPNFIALKNATIIVSPDKTIEKGTILIQDDKIINVGMLVLVPDDALIIDVQGKTIVPAFIETHSSLGLPKISGRHSFFPQIETSKEGAYYWNESIHPEVKASEIYTFDQKAIEDYINMGYGVVSTHQIDGICQGISAVFSLGTENYSKQLISAEGNPFFSFKKGISDQTYPSSQMGSIALLRQTLYDLKWYQNDVKKDKNLSLEALSSQIKKNIIFQSEDKYEILRAQKIANEFGLKFTFLGSGNEYEILDELAKLKPNVILPINFPLAYNVKDPYISKEISLSDLKHWENAQMNPNLLFQNKIPVSFTSYGLTSQNFWKNIKIAIKNGLKENEALEALTINPAKILGIEADFGTLEDGKKASFSVYNSNPFTEEAILLESWILGEQKVLATTKKIDIRGKYNLIVDNEYLTLEITGTKEKPSAKIKKRNVVENIEKKPFKKLKKSKTTEIKKDTLEVPCYINLTGNDITLQFSSEDLKWEGNVSLHAKANMKFGIFEGDGTISDGTWVKWSAIRNETAEKDKSSTSSDDKNDEKDKISVWYPNLAFGFEAKPQKETIVFQHATLWTNEKEGIIDDATLIIENGKIKFAGKGSPTIPNNAKVIDAKGKHVTSGIIDEHSHIAISRGVNEGGQAVSAEVNIGEVVKADDIDIYRQLSGGVTASQLLHGSANPIGGQSALIKLKWGHTPEEMLIPNAPKFIKFALGENVKQANWGEFNTVRFPQTRMGVEQIMYDAFERAKKYEKEKTANPNTYRKDLELDVILEILKKERNITCHSYVQSEINMLMHVADSLGFKINTFTHILEGYKVADKMKQHGAGASTFADWWAYKFEVNDAIPYNGAILSKTGVLTAINSDDAEMGRRLNQEAAKTVKYGGVSEEEAWKMVTLNPAKLLHLDERMGSLKVGKDADVVLWSTNPLSVEAKVETTIVDGEVLFDAKKDLELRKRNQAEKARIITKMLEDAEKGNETKAFNKKKAKHFHCNTFGEEGSEGQNEH